MIPSHNESYVSERQKGIFECELCGTTATRSFDLTRHKKKCHLAPATTSTSQTATTFTFLEKKPTTSSGAVEESATLVDQSASLEPFVPETPERRSLADESPPFSSDESLQCKLETLASLGERSEVSSEETLTGTTEAVDVQERAEDSEKNTSEDNRSRGRGRAGDCRGGRRFLLNKLQFASPKWSQSWFCGILAACVCNITACHE